MKTFDNLIKYLPLVSAFIIFLSAVRQFIFYAHFNIDVISYISISEFFLLFLKDSFLIIVAFMLTIPTIYIIGNKDKIYELLLKIKRWQAYLILSIIIILSFWLIFWKLNQDFSETARMKSEAISYFLVFGLIGFILIIYSTLKSEKFNTPKKIFFSGVAMSAFTIILSFFLANNFENSKEQNLVELHFNNRIIKTNNKLIFIGQSENYFFLYNKENETSRIIKKVNLKEIKVLKK